MGPRKAASLGVLAPKQTSDVHACVRWRLVGLFVFFFRQLAEMHSWKLETWTVLKARARVGHVPIPVDTLPSCDVCLARCPLPAPFQSVTHMRIRTKGASHLSSVYPRLSEIYHRNSLYVRKGSSMLPANASDSLFENQVVTSCELMSVVLELTLHSCGS